MNKKLKVVSSLALAGLMALNVCNPKTLATEIQDEIKTSPVGIYKQLVENKTIVPFVLANAEDCVTFKEIATSEKFANVTKFNGAAIPNDNTVVKTGDTFTANGKEYTVVIYGDVNKDGFVDVNDALQVKQYYVGNVELDKVQLEAADVRNNADVDVNDALDMQKFYVGSLASVIDKLPDMEDEKYDYSLSVNEGIINNQNVTSSKVTVNVAQVSDKEVSLTLNVKGLDVNGKDKVVTQPVTITKNTTKVEVDGIDVSDLVDGILSVELETENEEIVGTTTVIKNTVAPTATNVNTKRTATRTATLSLEGYGKNDITKVYYVIDGSISEADVKNAKTIEVSNNKVENYEISNELKEGESAKATLVLENKYGSRTKIEDVFIARDNANQATAVKELKATVTDGVATGEFTWKDKEDTSAKYVVNILKDNKVISSTETSSKTINILEMSKEPDALYKITEGTYKITVQVKGTKATEASEIVTSDEIVVSKLEAVKNVKLENKEDGKTYLTYDNSNKEGTFKEIKVQLISLDNDGKETTPTTVTPADKGVITLPQDNTIYFVKIIVVANDGQVSLINSDEATSNKIYTLTKTAPSLTVDTVKDTSVEATVSDSIAITGIKTEYKVEIYDASNVKELANGKLGSIDETKPQYTKISEKNVELSKEGKIVIDGLESNKKYAFKLITTVEGNKLESNYTSTLNTKATMPSISNLTVTKDDKDAKENSGKIYADENKMIINKTVYDNKDGIYPTEFANVVSLVEKFEAGDVISINEKTITATLNDKESTRTFGDLTGYTLNVTCNNKFAKTISGTFKEINLNGTGAIYNLNEVDDKAIINVNSDVEVKGDKTYTYVVNSKAIINSVKVSTVAKTTISANAQNLTVTPNTESNTLGFESDEVLTINFVGSKDQTSIQKGTINVVANKGVTITTNCNIAASMNVTVAEGTVDLTADALNGSKKVTIAKDGTITLATRKVAPVTLTKLALKDYTDEELIHVDADPDNGVEEKGIEGVNTIEMAQKVKEYINSIKSVITNNNALITATAGEEQATIELAK